MFWGGRPGRYELQRTQAIRIATITLASDSAITIVRFRPYKDFRAQVRTKITFGKLGTGSFGHSHTAKPLEARIPTSFEGGSMLVV